MTTPENKVKTSVKRVIEKYGSRIDSYWPVPSGYGESHLDLIMCVGGRYVSVETKAPGKKSTARQKFRIGSVLRAGGIALVIDGTPNTTTVEDLDILLSELVKDNK